MNAHTAEKDALIEERYLDRLSADERAARDWWHHYQDWQACLWIVRDRRRPEYRSIATDEETAKRDAAMWPGDYYAEPVSRPHLPTSVLPPGVGA